MDTIRQNKVNSLLQQELALSRGIQPAVVAEGIDRPVIYVAQKRVLVRHELVDTGEGTDGVARARRDVEQVEQPREEHVEAVALGGHEAVEVLEKCLHTRRTMPRNLAERLRERPGTGRVHDGTPLSRELTEQCERDDGLA